MKNKYSYNYTLHIDNKMAKKIAEECERRHYREAKDFIMYCVEETMRREEHSVFLSKSPYAGGIDIQDA